MGEDEAWNGTAKEWLIDEGYCYAGFVAGKADCIIYGAAAQEALGDKWAQIFAEATERDHKLEDESIEKVTVDETTCLWEIVEKGVKAKPKGGIWFGGVKYTLVREQELEIEGKPTKLVFGAAPPKKGVCIACSGQSVVVGFNNEQASNMQTGGNCQKAVSNFIGYLYQNE